jgi:hypothetical protein
MKVGDRVIIKECSDPFDDEPAMKCCRGHDVIGHRGTVVEVWEDSPNAEFDMSVQYACDGETYYHFEHEVELDLAPRFVGQ